MLMLLFILGMVSPSFVAELNAPRSDRPGSRPVTQGNLGRHQTRRYT